MGNQQEQISFFIDESGFDDKSSALVLGCIITEDEEGIRDAMNSLKQDILHDPHLVRIQKDIPKIGFHHTEDHERTKAEVLKVLLSQKFTAYIAYYDVSSKPQDYTYAYLELFKSLMYDRISDNAHCHIKIQVEEKSEITLPMLRNTLSSEVLPRIKPSISYEITFVDKTEPCIAVVDYICGIFRLHHGNLNKGNDMPKISFNTIRERIRSIKNLSTGEVFYRQNPFPLQST